MEYKIVFCDVDGCLTPESSGPFAAEAVLRLIDTFRGGGRPSLPPVVLCTGRPQPYVEALMKLLDLTLPAICENGAVIYHLDGNDARHGPGVTAEKLRGLRRVRAHIEDNLLPAHPGSKLQYGKEAQISVYSEDHDALLSMADAVAGFVEREAGPALDINTSHFYLNISLEGVSKGSAMGHILDLLGLSPADAAAIGDTEGDLAMRGMAAFLACPANARPALRRVADYVSPHPETEGVLDILEVITRS